MYFNLYLIKLINIIVRTDSIGKRDTAEKVRISKWISISKNHLC